MTRTNHILKDQVALVTGGAKGIGRQTALKLAAAGAHIVVNYFNSSDHAESLVAEITEHYDVSAYPVQGNVADANSVQQIMEFIKDEFGRLDILVSNAASGVLKPALEMTTKHWRWCMEINALALNILVQQARHLLQTGSRIIAISSLGAERAIPNYAFIGAAKAALESLVRSLSLELAPHDITVNALSAGVVDTDALKSFPNRVQILKQYQSRCLASRPLEPADVANAVYLLCLPEACMIRGQTIFVDAGYSIVG